MSLTSSSIMLGARRELRAPFLVDVLLVVTTLVLVLFSLVMVYSTTGILAQEKYGDELFFIKRQLFATCIGFGLMYLCSRVPLPALRRVSSYLLPLSVVLLLLTLIPGLGDTAGGARRWIQLPGIRFQPGEFVKIFFVVFLAGFWSRHEARLHTFVDGIAKPVLLLAFVAVPLLCQPDFGSTMVIAGVTLAMSLAAGARLRFMILGILGVAGAAAVLVLVSPYRMMRILSFLSPFADASGKGYQLIQSLIAVGTGEVTGVGLGGSQQKLFFLPAAHTDFIFAVIAEELGFLGCLAVIAMFLLFLWRGLRLASRMADDTFAYTLTVGLTLLIVLPAMLNMGVVLGLLPTKGMVLPLVGYGGSSLMACLMAVGLLLAVARSLHKHTG